MNNFFHLNSVLGAAFKDIFGDDTVGKPQAPEPASSKNNLPPATHISTVAESAGSVQMVGLAAHRTEVQQAVVA